MPSRPRHILLTGMTLITLLLISVVASFAESINYVYDDLNRLIQVQYGDGTKIEYTYDEVGNRLLKKISETGAPVTTASPAGGFYNATQSVILTCNDGTSGSGCNKIYYTTTGTTPTTSSSVYSTPISISSTKALKYFATDLNGNSEAVKNQTYTIDKILPTGSIKINAGATYIKTTSGTLNLTCSDSSGCDQVRFSNDNVSWSAPEAYAATKAWTLATGDGTKTVYARFRDKAGNWSTVYSDTIVLDATTPVTTASPAGGVSQTTQTVTLTCSEGTGTGCDKIYYTTDGTTPTTLSSVYSTSISISTTKTLKYFATDKAGNSEAVKSQTYVIDTAPPVTTASPAGGSYNATQSVTLTCDDGIGSGCNKIYYTTDGITPTTSSNVYSNPLLISAVTTLKFFATDIFGNSETVKSQSYTFNTTPPTGTVTINTGSTYTATAAVTLTLSCTDDAGTCNQMQFSNDNSSWSIPEAYAATKTWTLATGDGTKAIYAKFKDAAGNWSTTVSDTIVLDTMAPVIAALPAAGMYNTGQAVTLTCNDGAGAGCDKIYYTTNDTKPTTSSSVYSTPINIATTKILRYFATDLAGNESAEAKQTYTIDTDPVGYIEIESGNSYTDSTSVTLSLSCSDDHNSCSQMQFSNDKVSWSQPEVYGNRKAWTLTAGDGAKTVYARFRDAAGNWSATAGNTIVLDTIAPVTTASPAGGVYHSNLKVTLTCSDVWCDTVYYAIDGTTSTCGNYWIGQDGQKFCLLSTPSDITITTTTTLKYFAFDMAGNKEAVKSQIYTIVTSGPVTTATPAGGTYNASQTVTLTCSGGTGPACDKIYFTTDGTTPTTLSSVYSAPISVSSNATLKYFATDLAGNSETTKSQTYTFDTTLPTGAVTINGGATYVTTTAVTLSLSCTDNAGACNQMQFSSDNANWSTPEAYTASKAWTLATGDGTKTVYARFKDAAGNWSTTVSDTIVLDSTAPSVTLTSPTAGTTTDNTPLLTYAASDGTVVVKVDGSIVNKVSGNSLDALANGSHAVRVEATDAAGNAGFAEVTFTVSTPVASGSEDFETGNLSRLPWVTTGNGLWAAKTTRVHGGAYAAEAPVSIRNDESASMEVTMDCAAGNISFWYSVSSEENDDELLFYIDGVQKLANSGEVPWTQATFPVSAGSHTFKWVYSKDGIFSDGADTAWVDDIVFPVP